MVGLGSKRAATGARCRQAQAALIALAPLWAEAALAQTAPPPPPGQGEVLQRQQQERIDQDQTRILTNPNPQTVIEVPTHEKATAANGTCQTITQITFDHTPHMTARQRDKLITPYLSRCLGLGDVENLLSDITRFYVDQSRPTTRVYIRPQSLAKGVLVLDVVEGRVEKVTLDEKSKRSLNRGTAFGQVANREFNLRVFEQGLDQINRLGSNHATLNIVPGSDPGNSVVVIHNDTTRRQHLVLSTDNTGSPESGRYQGAATIVLDDTLGLNDLISFTRRQSIPFDNNPDAKSWSNSLLVSLPYNSFTLTAGFSSAGYKSQVVAASGTVYQLTGDTRQAFGTLSDVLWRTRRNKLELSATLTAKRNHNYIDDQFLSVSSRNLTVLDVEADLSTLFGKGGSLRVGAGWSGGLRAFSALDDRSVTPGPGVPRAQFNKATAHVFLNLPFKLDGQQLSFSSEIDGQYSFDPLYSSERIVIGSPFTVRGFLRGSLVSDHGVYAQNDLSLTKFAHLGSVPVLLRPHVGADVGYAKSIGVAGGGDTVAGATAGMTAGAGPLSFDVSVHHQIAHAQLADEGTLVFFRATTSF